MKPLFAVTPEGQIPEIASEKSPLTAAVDQLPKIVEKFSALEDETKKAVTEIGDVAGKVKDSPLLGLGGAKEKNSATPAPQRPRLPHSP
jgi:hypothetical protein